MNLGEKSVTSSIAAKFAFFPPSPPSYKVVANESCRASTLCIPEIPRRENVDVLKLRTRRENEIIGVYVKHSKALVTMIYSQGNAADVLIMGEQRMKLLITPTENSSMSYAKEKYEPLWINGGGHCNLEIYPVCIEHLKKFVLSPGKSKPATNGSHRTSLESDTHSKRAENCASNTFNLQSDLPEISRNSLDSCLDKKKKSNKPEKSRMSTDRVDRFRRRNGLVW